MFTFRVALVASALFLGMIGFVELGRWLGRLRREALPEAQREGIGVLDGGIFALLGLLTAFTFSGAAARFDWHRQLVVDEANAIGTAYLRVDLLPAAVQPAIRGKFRDYTKIRLGAFQKFPDFEAADREIERGTMIQGEIWKIAVASLDEPAFQPARILVLPALNAMFDIATTRTMAFETHPPAIIFVVLIVVALVVSYLVGDIMAGDPRRNWRHMIAFALTISLTLYVILDLEFPRLGLLRVEDFDQVLINVLAQMR